MKTKMTLRILMILAIATGLSMTGCKKDTSTPPPDNTQSASLQQLSVDDNEVQNMSDETSNDAMNVMNGGSLKSGLFWPCNATVDSSNVVNDTLIYYITYNGKNCAETLIRTGQVRVKRQVNTYWPNPGAQVVLELIDFQVTRIATGKTRTFNGRHIFTNVSGGVLWNLATGMDAIIDRVEGHMTVTFDDGSQRFWQIARQRVFSIADTALVMTIDGFGTADGYSNLVTWGLERNGAQFYAPISQSVVHKQRCLFDPVSGIISYQIPSQSKSATVTFGYDDNNQLITNGDCPTKFRFDWQSDGNSGTVYLPLH
jgi:hypothetical protein